MNRIFTYTKDANIETLMKKHPILDGKTRNKLIDYMICKHYSRIYSSVHAYTRDKTLTEDILQETFLRTSSKFNEIKSLSSFESYNIQTAKNIAKRLIPIRNSMHKRFLSLYRADGSINEELVAVSGSCNPYAITEYKELKTCVKKLLGRLSSSEREILVRKCFLREPYENIVKRLGLKPCTARSKCQRARRKLSDMLNLHYY